MNHPEAIYQFIDTQLADYFQRLADNIDISPAERFRLEGYLQAVLEFELISADQLTEIVNHHCQFKSINTAAEVWELPYQMPAAPVVPSTKSD